MEKKQRPGIIGVSLLLFMLCLIPGLGETQLNRGLGFRGLIPPPQARQGKYKGEVNAIDLPLIRIKSDKYSGKVFLGPAFFFKEKRFAIYRGQKLILWAAPMKVEGEDVLVAYKLKDTESDKVIVLRDSNGEPIWWGQGERGGNAPGKKER